MNFTEIRAAWDDLSVLLHVVADELPQSRDGFIEVSASAPPGTSASERTPATSSLACRSSTETIRRKLRELDALVSDSGVFARDPEEGAWETLQVRVNGWSGNAWISVVNATGQQEHVTTFGAEPFSGDRSEPDWGYIFAQWCENRTGTPDEGTSWDAARKTRKVVWSALESRHSLIDPGANWLVGFAGRHGCTTFTSCEGHPLGAHVGFSGGPPGERLAAALRDTGSWSTERHREGGFVARMIAVGTVAARDAVWRSTCCRLEAELGLTAAEPVSLPR